MALWNMESNNWSPLVFDRKVDLEEGLRNSSQPQAIFLAS